MLFIILYGSIRKYPAESRDTWKVQFAYLGFCFHNHKPVRALSSWKCGYRMVYQQFFSRWNTNYFIYFIFCKKGEYDRIVAGSMVRNLWEKIQKHPYSSQRVRIYYRILIHRNRIRQAIVINPPLVIQPRQEAGKDILLQFWYQTHNLAVSQALV